MTYKTILDVFKNISFKKSQRKKCEIEFQKSFVCDLLSNESGF